jgi:chaperone required for assembly of F1-ATPase
MPSRLDETSGSLTGGIRDFLEDMASKQQPAGPMQAAQRAMRPPLRQRFYRRAETSHMEDGFAVLLDGKPIRTPGRRALAAPTQPLAEAIAAEWEAQRDVIDPARMPLTRLANSIIDGVADTAAAAAVADEIGRYLASDLLVYRAEAPAQLVERESGAWDPILAWARDSLGARFVLAQGTVHVTQPPEVLAAVRTAIPADYWRLGAVSSITTLTGSALLALALAHGRLTADQVWEAAHVDEDWNMEQWGRDALVLERRAYRFAELQAAANVLRLFR